MLKFICKYELKAKKNRLKTRNIFKKPQLINIHTNRFYWHSGAGKDNHKIFDRLNNEIKLLGFSAKSIDQQIKQKVKNLWEKNLRKL